MRDYSFSEIQEMQDRAMERVRNMQQRAKETAERANAEMEREESAPQQYGEYDSIPKTDSLKAHHIKMPTDIPKRDSEYPDFKSYFGAETKRQEERKTKTDKANLWDSMLKEPDRAMLLPLLLLLRSEGKDEALLLALLYIMS